MNQAPTRNPDKPAPAAAPRNSTGLPAPARQWAAGALLCCIGVTVLDANIANIALPTISRELNVGEADSIWIVNAYTISVMATLLPLSAVAERVGFKLMFRLGLALFTIASLLCALSGNLHSLVAARMLQGLGAASMMCLFGGLVRHIYPAHKLAAGISINAMTVGVMSVVGPSVGAAILSVASWQWIFGFTVPICLFAMYAAGYLPEAASRSKGRFDYLSAVLNIFTFALLLIGLDAIGRNPGRGLFMLGLAAISGYVLIRRSLPQATPLVPVDLFRFPIFKYAVIVSALTFTAQMISMLALPFYYQHNLGMPLQKVGLLFGVWPVGSVVIASLSAKLCRYFKASLLAGIGAALMAIGIIALMALPADISLWYYVAPMFVAGMGFGFFQTPNNRAMLLSTPLKRSGATGGVQATTRLFGQGIGAACVAISFHVDPVRGPMYVMGFASALVIIAVIINLFRYIKGLDTDAC